jgi:para-aminobenzoate synthetase/4-amino-4-deoxychorismate lyase
VGRDGRLRAEAALLPEATLAPVRLALAPTPVESSDVFLFHKTTQRQVYEAAGLACPDADDVLLWNERGELTETCAGNIAVLLGGEWLTPPVACGLLAGTYRAQLLDDGRLRESTIGHHQLAQAEGLAVVNAVRLWRPAILLPGF